MKVFVSWSGNPSKNVALILRKYLRHIIQSLDVFVSDHDIAAGDRWEVRLANELEHADFGILCLSPESLHEDWLLFEAGALTKITEGRACGLLIGKLGHTDVTGPLSQFQNIRFEHDGFRKLLDSINDLLKPPLDKEQLDTVFDACWPKINADYEEALKSSDSGTSTQPERSVQDLLEEVLTIVRTTARERASESSSGRRERLELSIMKQFCSVLSAEERKLLMTLASCTIRGFGDKAQEEARRHPKALSMLREMGFVNIDEDGQVIVKRPREILSRL